MICQVFVDDNAVYDPRVDELVIMQDKLNLELNKSGSYVFTVPPSNPYYGTFNKLKSIVKFVRDGKILFRGRILNSEYDFYNNQKLTCEGELAFLNDSIQRPYDFQSGDKHTTVEALFTYFISKHNNQVDEAKRFKVGKITVKDVNNYIVRADSDYSKTLDAINKKLVETMGGFLRVRHESDGNYIDYLAELSEVSSQSINFGENLLDAEKEIRGENVVTALIPLGAKGDKEGDKRLAISSLADETSGEIRKKGDYVYSVSGVAQYGWIFDTETWDDVKDAKNLLTKAKSALSQRILLENSIELKAADLAGIDATLAPFDVGVLVPIYSVPHGLNSKYLVRKMSLSATNPASGSLTIGSTFKSFTERSANSASAIATVQQSLSKIGNNVATVVNNYALIKKDVQELQGEYVSSGTFDERLNPFEEHISFVGQDTKLSGRIIQEDVKLPSLLNSWNNAAGYGNTSYWIDSCGIVHLSGVMSSGTASSGTTLFILPEGYRPTVTELFGTIKVQTDGTVLLAQAFSDTNLSLCGISFRAKKEATTDEN